MEYTAVLFDTQSLNGDTPRFSGRVQFTICCRMAFRTQQTCHNCTLESPVSVPNEALAAGAQAFLANIRAVATVSPEVARAIVQELIDQRTNLKLIASENYCSLA